MEKSRSCQFVLRLNVRTTLTLANALKSELLRLNERAERPAAESEEDVRDKERSQTFSPVLLTILPLFRLSSARIASYRGDIVQYEDHLEPYVKDMYRALGRCFTMLNEVAVKWAPGLDIGTAPYMLPEDHEAAGLKRTDDASLPLALRFQMAGDSKPRKPRPNTVARSDTDTETIWRIRDILNVALFLASDVDFPLAFVENAHGDENSCLPELAYTEDVPPMQLGDKSGQSAIATTPPKNTRTWK